MKPLKTEFVDLQDLQVAYTQQGSGKNLLLLHGNSASKGMFKQYQLEDFAGYHTYALDSRGHGQSQSQDESLSINQFSDDVIAFCASRGIREAAVIGYSDGGNIALFLAKKAPELFTRVIAISPNTLVSGTTEESLNLICRMMRIMRLVGMKQNLKRFELMMHDIGLGEEDLAGIRTKVNILYAEKDMIKEDHILYIARSIPNSRVKKIASCTHLNIFKQKEAIAEMHQFLSE